MIEDTLARLLGEHVRVHSSGRTDAGVHARGMVACFRTSKSLPMTAYSKGLNALLPPDIAVLDAEEASLDFDPRHDAIGKHYRYTLLLGSVRSPLSRFYSWHLRGGLDLERMRAGATHFIGDHDFAAFRTSGCSAVRTRRRLDRVDITREGPFVLIDVYGSGFLRNMVRIMVGTLVSVGQGKLEPDHVRRCLLEPDTEPGPTAPAHGLCLYKVFY
jgi:tRNA pseudouridine38-40 synthase